MTIKHIRKVPLLGKSSGTGSVADCVVREVDIFELRDWQLKIHDKFIATDTTRLDRSWNWPRYYFGSLLLNNPIGRSTAAFQLVVRGPNDRSVPIGQALLVSGFPHPGEKGGSSTFVWFLTSTPTAALSHFGVTQKFVVMPLLLDTAIQESRLLGLKGKIALHADSKGTPSQQQALIAKYKQYGMQQHPRLLGRMLSIGRKRMDAQYFTHSPESALAESKKFDHLR